MSTSAAAPDAASALRTNPSATAWAAASYAARAASASAYAVASKRAIAAGDTSVRTSDAGPKATPGTTGVPRSSRLQKLVTMATSQPAALP